MMSDRLILSSCLIYFGLVLALFDCNITTSVIICLTKLLFKDCCRWCKTLQKFFHYLFNFGDIWYFFYFIDIPPIKKQLAKQKKARLASVKYFKEQKLEQSQSTNIEQLCIDNNQLNTSDTKRKEDRKRFWCWNENANETDSDPECSRESDENEFDCGPEDSKTEKKAVSETQPGEIQ